jgi:site-specific DNA-methyltransferase (adenine-specific)
MITLHFKDCLEVMKGMVDNSVDAVVCDPPYGLKFMGKKWDYDVPSVEIWQECLRVLKPGGHLLAFAGTRTQHRMACRIEDAGFEIRDMIAWVYGSGFPKSLSIGKAIDKLQGNEREIVDNPLIKKQTSQNRTVAFGTKGTVTHISKGTSEWEGWGTALKPALEPITVARKPIEQNTIAENVLKWGTGG